MNGEVVCVYASIVKELRGRRGAAGCQLDSSVGAVTLFFLSTSVLRVLVTARKSVAVH